MLCIWEVLFASKKQNSLLRCALAQQSLLFLLVLGYTTYLNNKRLRGLDLRSKLDDCP